MGRRAVRGMRQIGQPLVLTLALGGSALYLSACSSGVVEPILPPSWLDGGDAEVNLIGDADVDAVSDEGRRPSRDAQAPRAACDDQTDGNWSLEETMLLQAIGSVRAYPPEECNEELLDFLRPSADLHCVARLGLRDNPPPTGSREVTFKRTVDSTAINEREVQVGLTPGTVTEELRVFNAAGADQIYRELRASARYACIVSDPRLVYVGIARSGSAWIVDLARAAWAGRP